MVSPSIQHCDELGHHITPASAVAYIPKALEPDRVLVVNDISRSGSTLQAAIEFLGSHSMKIDVMTAVLFLSRRQYAVT